MEELYDKEGNSFYLENTVKFYLTKVFNNKMISEKINLNFEIIFDIENITNKEILENYLFKINFFFENIINNSICLKKENSLLNLFINGETYNKNIDNNIILLDEDPYDDVLLLYLQAKMNSFGNDIIYFPYIKIKKEENSLEYSFMGNSIEELPDAEKWLGTSSYFKIPWWSRNDFSTIDLTIKENINEIPKIYNFHILEFFNNKNIIAPTQQIVKNDDGQIVENVHNNDKIINVSFKRRK